MSFQGTGLVEGLLANWTREGSGAGVDSLVAVEVGQVGEVLATGAENTYVGILTFSTNRF